MKNEIPEITPEVYLGGKLSRSHSRRESVFGHFTKFNVRKTDSSQNSISEKQTLHKNQKNGLFTNFNIQT